MNPIRVLSVFGTRPEAIKMCPLALTLRERPEFESLVCVTAQHREMLDSVLKTFSLRPDYVVQRHRQQHHRRQRADDHQPQPFISIGICIHRIYALFDYSRLQRY